jgi:hypothetical protein
MGLKKVTYEWHCDWCPKTTRVVVDGEKIDSDRHDPVSWANMGGIDDEVIRVMHRHGVNAHKVCFCSTTCRNAYIRAFKDTSFEAGAFFMQKFQDRKERADK